MSSRRSEQRARVIKDAVQQSQSCQMPTTRYASHATWQCYHGELLAVTRERRGREAERATPRTGTTLNTFVGHA
eukprot:3757999-Rhodomonas_salina.1